MRIEFSKIEDFTPSYPIEHIGPIEQLLFMDIETTGFSSSSTYLYLIGVAYYEKGFWRIKQWFAESPEEESSVIECFFRFARHYSYLIHFNGNNFDIPYILDKCKQYKLNYDFSAFKGFDIYRRVAPYKDFLHLPNCKQKTLETFIGLDREDKYTGKDLINIYNEHVACPSEYNFNMLILHNNDDIKGMLNLTCILSYYDMFNLPLIPLKAEKDTYKDSNGDTKEELLMKFEIPSRIPTPVTTLLNNCYFHAEERECILKVPIVKGCMKFFYENYQDYYFLPNEDTAIHKSVAKYVNKEHREQATAQTCFTNKEGSFVKEWAPIIEPAFKRRYFDKEFYFEITPELKKDKEAFAKYASHVINIMAGIRNKA